MNNQHFVDRLLRHPRWVIVLCNILDGLDAGLYDQDFVRNAVDWWRESFLRRKGMEPTSNEDALLSETLDMLVTQKSLSGQPFRLKTKVPITAEDTTTSYAHSMAAESLLRWVLHEDDQNALAADAILGVGIPAFLNHSISSPVRIGPGKCIGKPGGVVFLAPFDDVAPLLASMDKSNLVRDRLGLVHWEQHKEYVTLELAADAPALSLLGRPTFVDAGAHRRFKAVACESANKSRDDWGFTLDLEQFANTSAVADGLPERVSELIDANGISSFMLHPLGLVAAENRATTPKDDDKNFAECLCNGRDVVDIEKRMKRIV